MLRRPITPFVVATVACSLWAVPLAGAYAATIKGCIANGTGQLRVLKAGGKCTATEKALSWSSAGVQGPPGPQGAAGSQGPTGPQGTPGLSGFQTVTAQDAVPAGNIGTVDVACPGGETALSGGWAVPYTATVLQSFPTSASVWRTQAAFPSVGGTLVIYVQCAQVTAAAARSVEVAAATRATPLSARARPAAGR